MKVLIRIPTVQFGYIEIEGDPKDLEQMIDIQNKYGESEIQERKKSSSVQPAEQTS